MTCRVVCLHVHIIMGNTIRPFLFRLLPPEYSPVASTSTTNLIAHDSPSINASNNGEIPHVRSETYLGGYQHHAYESSDDDAMGALTAAAKPPVKNGTCGGGAAAIGGSCCSAQSPVKVVLDIEDILARTNQHSQHETKYDLHITSKS